MGRGKKRKEEVTTLTSQVCDKDKLIFVSHRIATATILAIITILKLMLMLRECK